MTADRTARPRTPRDADQAAYRPLVRLDLGVTDHALAARIREAFLQGVEGVDRDPVFELVGRLNNEVAHSVDEAHGPLVEEAFLPEQPEWQRSGVLDEEVHFCFPTQVWERWDDQVDHLGYGVEPFASEVVDALGARRKRR